MSLTVQTQLSARAAVGLASDTAIPLGDPQQSYLHLATLWRPGSLLELRVRSGGAWTKIFHEQPRAAAAQAQRLKNAGDVYVGVLPRLSAHYGGDTLPPYASIMWAEADTGSSAARVLDFAPLPPLVIRSSPGKLHAYWPLDRDIPLEYIERGNKRLAHYLGCDPRATNAGRILRVAGTRNHKPTGGRVAITRFEPAPNVSARALVGELPDPAPAKPLVVARPPRPADVDTDRLRDVPARVYIPALCQREVYHGLCHCPFHKGGQERTPSLSVTGPNEELWLCFGCDEGGDIFTFAARLWGMDERTQFPDLKRRLKETL